MKLKPDFIAIGPEKTGTSFLYAVLKENPQVSLPPRKEIRYWNEGEQIPPHSLKSVLTSQHWHYRELRTILRKTSVPLIRNVVASAIRGRPPDPNLLWDLRYTIGRRGTAWYDSLFPHDGMMAGDISPLYYHISESRIKECHQHNPKAKVIVLVRNPVDRVWSKARMIQLHHKGRNPEEFDAEEFRTFAQDAYKSWSPYLDTIQAWKSIFADVHVALYDELQRDSGKWYRKICKFLEIDMNDSALLGDRINQGVDLAIPAACERILFQQYGHELRELGEVWSNPYWLKRYEELVIRFPKTRSEEG